jgi:hypothetical protein
VFSDKHAEAKQKIEILRFALKTNAVNKKAKDLNMSIILNITNVQDRTIFLESNYEYRFGFDFILRATTPQVETFNSIEEINGTITTTNEITENTNTFEVTG